MIHLPLVNQKIKGTRCIFKLRRTTLHNEKSLGQAVNHWVQMVLKILFYTSKSEMSWQWQQECRRLSFPPPWAAAGLCSVAPPAVISTFDVSCRWSCARWVFCNQRYPRARWCLLKKIPLNHNLVNCEEPVWRSCLAVCSKHTGISSRSVYCMWWEPNSAHWTYLMDLCFNQVASLLEILLSGWMKSSFLKTKAVLADLDPKQRSRVG